MFSFLCFAACALLAIAALLRASPSDALLGAACAGAVQSFVTLLVANVIAPRGRPTPFGLTGYGIDISRLARRCPRWIQIVLPIPPACLVLGLAGLFAFASHAGTGLPAWLAVLGMTFNFTTFAVFTGMLAPGPVPVLSRKMKLPAWDWLAPWRHD